MSTSIPPRDQVRDSDIVSVNHKLSTRQQQREYFWLNATEQFRAYRIFKGDATTDPYPGWNDIEVLPALKIYPDNETPEQQREYFWLNAIEQFRAYRIFKGDATTDPYSVVPYPDIGELSSRADWSLFAKDFKILSGFPNDSAAGIKILIIGSGFDVDEIISRGGPAFVDELNSMTFTGQSQETDTDTYHGTFSFRTIYTFAPGAEYYFAKIEVDGSGDVANADYLIDALEWGRTLDVDIINISLNYSDSGPTTLTQVNIEAIRASINSMPTTIVVCSAENDILPEALNTVSGAFVVGDMTTRGDYTDIVLPNMKDNLWSIKWNDTVSARKCASVMSGMLAICKSRGPTLSKSELETKMFNSATNNGVRDKVYGYGIPMMGKFLIPFNLDPDLKPTAHSMGLDITSINNRYSFYFDSNDHKDIPVTISYTHTGINACADMGFIFNIRDYFIDAYKYFIDNSFVEPPPEEYRDPNNPNATIKEKTFDIHVGSFTEAENTLAWVASFRLAQDLTDGAQGDNPNTEKPETESSTSSMAISTDPRFISGLKSTIFHEVAHVFQNGYNLVSYNDWRNPDLYTWFFESTASAVQTLEFPTDDGFHEYREYNFINNPETSLTSIENYHQYSFGVFIEYIVDKIIDYNGVDFIRKLFEEISSKDTRNGDYTLSAFDNVLTTTSSSTLLDVLRDFWISCTIMETDETKPYGWAKTSNPSGNVNIPSTTLAVGVHTTTMQPYSGKIFTIYNENSTNIKITANSSLVKLGLMVKIGGIDSIVIGDEDNDDAVMFNRTSATVVVVAGTNDILNHAPVTFTLDIESEA